MEISAAAHYFEQVYLLHKLQGIIYLEIMRISISWSLSQETALSIVDVGPVILISIQPSSEVMLARNMLSVKLYSRIRVLMTGSFRRCLGKISLKDWLDIFPP